MNALQTIAISIEWRVRQMRRHSVHCFFFLVLLSSRVRRFCCCRCCYSCFHFEVCVISMRALHLFSCILYIHDKDFSLIFQIALDGYTRLVQISEIDGLAHSIHRYYHKAAMTFQCFSNFRNENIALEINCEEPSFNISEVNGNFDCSSSPKCAVLLFLVLLRGRCFPFPCI